MPGFTSLIPGRDKSITPGLSRADAILATSQNNYKFDMLDICTRIGIFTPRDCFTREGSPMSVTKFCSLLSEAKVGKNDKKWFPPWVRRYASMAQVVQGKLSVTECDPHHTLQRHLR